MTRALVLFAVCAAAGSACAGEAPLPPQPLGRLFFTPAERAQLDIARVQKKPTQQATADAPEPVPTSQVVTYGGIVRRSDGKSMLWINNRLVEEKEALSGLNLKGRVRPDGAVTVQVPQTGGSIDVKVGQSVELQTGRVAETRRPSPETNPPPNEPAAPSADGKPPAAPPSAAAASTPPLPPAPAARPAEAATEKQPPSGSVGLKLDRGGRALQPAEEQAIRR